MSKQKISVIGIGRLGLSFALLLSSKGYEVCGCDVNESHVQSLKYKTFKSDEPQINEMFQNCNIVFTTSSAEAFAFSELVFIFVPTPSKENGEYDHQYIEQVISDFENYFKQAAFKTIVISCTVMPEYCRSLQDRLSRLKVSVVYMPSFIAQGTICNNLKNADIVLVGGKITMAIRDIYIAIMDKSPNFKFLSLIGAEIAKIALNCFLTTKISFANRIGEICINSGIEKEVSDVLNAIGSDRRVGNEFLRYGYGFSGVCLPRDNRALGKYASNIGLPPQFQEMIDMANEQHLSYLYDYFVKSNPNKEIPFVFYQLSYKRGVNILIDSQPLKLCLLLLEAGYNVSIVESENVSEQAKVILKKYENMVSYTEDRHGFLINLE